MSKRNGWMIGLCVAAWGAAAACAGGKPAGPLPGVKAEVERLIPSVDSMKQISVTTKMSLMNPRETEVVVESISYEVKSIEGDVISASGELQAGQALEAGKTVELTLERTIALPQDPQTYLGLLKTDTVPVMLSGVVRLADGTETSFSQRGSVAPPNLPRFIVQEAQAASYETEGIEVTFYLRLINENPFGVVVDSADYAISIDGKDVSEGTAGIGIRLAASGVQEYTVNVAIDESTYGAAYKAKMDQEKLDYVMKGQLVVSGMELPVETEGEIKLQ